MAYNPLDTSPGGPAQTYRDLRNSDELPFFDMFGAYLVSRYDDVRAVLDDPETFSSANALPDWTMSPPEVIEAMGDAVPRGISVVNTDPPLHTAIRRVLRTAFSGERVVRLREPIAAIAGELADGIAAAGRAELVSGYADRLVQAVANRAFGFPAEDFDRVARGCEVTVAMYNPMTPPETKLQLKPEFLAYERYLLDLIADRRANPRDDVISDLVNGAEADGLMSEADLVWTLRAFRVAGHDVTRDLIASTLLSMLTDRRHWEAAVADPAVIPALVEEGARRDAPHRGLMRVTTTDTEVGGRPIPAGTQLLLLFGSACLDDAHFPDAEAFTPGRPNIGDHLSFGGGPHVCPGANLARTQARIAIETLTRRLPDLRLTDDYEPVYIPNPFFRGLAALDVTW